MSFLTSITLFIRLFVAPPDSNSISYTPSYNLKEDVITVQSLITKEKMNFVYNKQVYDLRCDTMPNVIFWRKIMHLDKDSALLNRPENRHILHTVHCYKWDTLCVAKKNAIKDSLRYMHCLMDSARILMTTGKSFFYNFEKASANFDRGITDFIANGVDPWYAQTILMIESPNKLQKSNVGAYGSFQLMKDVARLFGLKVNKQVDERSDFDRSAYAASSLIKKICIPKTRDLLDSLGIKDYKENDLWFRLLVMHCYHAGAGNVKKALFSFRPTRGDIHLIYTLWYTQTKQFKSASQNYSQLVLAALLEVNDKFGLGTNQKQSLIKQIIEAPIPYKHN